MNAAIAPRSVLFVPALDRHRARRAAEADADVIVLDLEDAVAPGAKTGARAGLGAFVAEFAAAGAAPDRVFVRVNAPASAWFADDMAALEALDDVGGVVVPKAEHDSWPQVRAALGPSSRLIVAAGIETARGVHRVDDVLAFGDCAWAYFGAEDFVTDMGGVRSVEGDEVLYARSRVALACRVAGVGAVDQVVTAFRDPDRFAADAAVGRRLGYGGKLCIHPVQVAAAHRAFDPSEEEIAAARRIVDHLDGDGRTLAIDGEMVDEPMLTRARALLRRVEGDAGDAS